jgi:hypothetical protein
MQHKLQCQERHQSRDESGTVGVEGKGKGSLIEAYIAGTDQSASNAEA